jgi:hypothetical protein
MPVAADYSVVEQLRDGRVLSFPIQKMSLIDESRFSCAGSTAPSSFCSPQRTGALKIAGGHIQEIEYGLLRPASSQSTSREPPAPASAAARCDLAMRTIVPRTTPALRCWEVDLRQRSQMASQLELSARAALCKRGRKLVAFVERETFWRARAPVTTSWPNLGEATSTSFLAVSSSSTKMQQCWRTSSSNILALNQ